MRLLSAYAVGAAVLLVFACGDGSKHDHDEFREDVIMCEDAAAYLVTCCPGFNAAVVECKYGYDYVPGGCESGSTTDKTSPGLSLDESRCILGRTCEDLRAAHVCTRAWGAQAYTEHSGGSPSGEYGQSSYGSSHPAVCP
jgi:hypothetical protein